MKRIEVKLSLPIVAPLLDLIKIAGDTLAAQIAAPLTLDDVDVDFRAEWKAELLEGQRAELSALLGLFDSDFFANGVVAFDADNADVIARACSAVRLRLRRHDLRSLGDEQLESGAVEMERLPEALQKPFMTYVFLGTIQELIIQHLDAEILRGSDEDDGAGDGDGGSFDDGDERDEGPR